MYIIQDTTGIQNIICLQYVKDNVDRLTELYKKLDGVDVIIRKSYYPNSFIKTLDFSHNVLRTTNRELHKQFKQWLYVTTKENGTKAYFATKHGLYNSKQYVKDKVKSLYNYGLLFMYLPAITGTFYNTIFKYMSLLKHKEDTRIEAFPGNDESNNDSTNVSTNDSNNTVNNLEGNNELSSKVFTSSLNIEEMLANIEKKGIDEIQKDISKLSSILTGLNLPGLNLPSLDIPISHVIEEPISTEQTSTHESTTFDLKSLDTDVSGLIDNKYDICDGYAVFRHKKNKNIVYASVEYMEDKAIDNVHQINHLPEKFNIILKTYNKYTCKYSISCLDETYWRDIQDLLSIGLENIEIKDIVFFEPMSKLDGIVPIIQSTEDTNKYIQSMYILRKFLCSRPEQGKIIKKVLESVYTKYEFNFKEQVSLKSVYLNYKNHCGMIPDVLDYERFSKVMVYLGYNIKDGDLLYMKKRLEPSTITIHSFKQNIDSMIIKRNLQLRSEPPVNLLPNVSPWQMSPLI